MSYYNQQQGSKTHNDKTKAVKNLFFLKFRKFDDKSDSVNHIDEKKTVSMNLFYIVYLNMCLFLVKQCVGI